MKEYQVDLEPEDQLVLMEMCAKMLPEGHYPTDALLIVAHKEFEKDITLDTLYTIVPSPMAPHAMRGLFETAMESAAERYNW